jgi:hypothetical protein
MLLDAQDYFLTVSYTRQVFAEFFLIDDYAGLALTLESESGWANLAIIG